MNENNLYYKRGMYLIDKLLNTYSNNPTFYNKRKQLSLTELKRIMTNRELVGKDINSFNITALTSLFGINKENIENTNKHDDYDINYINKKIKDNRDLTIVKKVYHDYDKDRDITTKFDDWLSVENCDHPSISYMMNIRNGLLHSEYEILDKYGFLLRVQNSNYTHFKSSILLPGIIAFSRCYFGNNPYTGLQENTGAFEIDSKRQLKNKEELVKAIRTLRLHKINYENKSTSNKNTPDSLLYDYIIDKSYNKNKNIDLDKTLKKICGKDYNYSVNQVFLDEDQILMVLKMIDKYYGKEFYNLDQKSQFVQICNITKYLLDSRSTISDWICDYMEFFEFLQIVDEAIRQTKKYDECMKPLMQDTTEELNLRSVFACKTSLLIIKLYHILYRLQNKKYDEVNYNDINFDITGDDYSYERIENATTIYDFSIDEAKMRLKNPTLSDKEIKNKCICEIIRNSLAHGNIEIKFKLIDDEIVEYIEFEDNYHSKIRKLEMTLNKLEQFLNSNAFSVENCIIKESAKVKTL